jgi:hypothetical protein
MFTSFFVNKVRLVILAFVILAGLLAGFAAAKAASGPANTAPGSTLNQRVAQRKGEQRIKLNTNDKQRIQFQCTLAQSKLRTMGDTYSSSSDNRDKVYHQIDAALWIIIGKLKVAGKDTFSLEQQRTGYIKRVKAFENQSEEFQQVIKDMLAMNCKADPTGFKALLETARDYNAQIRSSFISIKAYLVDTVQPTISQQSDDLKIKTEAQ